MLHDNTKKIRELLTDELDRLKAFRENLDRIAKAIGDVILGLGSELSKTREELAMLRNQLPLHRREYGLLFLKQWMTNLLGFKNERVDVLQNYPQNFNRQDAEKINWSLEINADDFKALGERIMVANRDVPLGHFKTVAAIQAEHFIKNKLMASLRDTANPENITNELVKTHEVQNIISILVREVDRVFVNSDAAPRLQHIMGQHESDAKKIADCEQLVENLEKRITLLDKYKESLEDVFEVGNRMFEEKRGDPAVINHVLESGRSLMNEAILASGLDLDAFKLDDPLAEEPRPSSPSMR